MTWTYSGNPAASSRDAVRFLIGDTQSTDPQFTDEEIDSLLAGQTNVTLVAVDLCDRLTGKYGRLVSQSVGQVSVQYGERFDHYAGLLSRLRRTLAPSPYAGGISIGDKDSQESDDDWDQPVFKRGMNAREG